ncbi:chemocyanin-like [Lycium barbarum]|uniref:chemocyanin-like n=1 Tax=Lycium barbarum TaxID=112863 RepID=UPI00293EEA90|nr:chemocyanin-like [Lycium barbarum]
MVFSKEAMVFLSTTVVLSFFTATLGGAAVYKVGDADGWTIGVGANVDYHTWAASKNFRVGDILVFEYNKTQNNVLRVSLPDYHSCNAGNPITSYSSGNDSITIKGPGHYYYICGFPGHCQAGQKLDVRVLKVSKPTDSPSGRPSPIPSPSSSPSPGPEAASSTTSGHVIAPSPATKSSASSLFLNNELGFCFTLFMIVIGAGYLLY